MKVGDKLKLRPYLNAESGQLAAKAQVCTVTYIHPERRYYVVEFTSERGETFRQTMYFPEREGDMRRPMTTIGTGCEPRGTVSPGRARMPKPPKKRF